MDSGSAFALLALVGGAGAANKAMMAVMIGEMSFFLKVMVGKIKVAIAVRARGALLLRSDLIARNALPGSLNPSCCC